MVAIWFTELIGVLVAGWLDVKNTNHIIINY